jgi:phosphatidylserine/phosphatidylglycerophosphate/cardiolipin synthase-like enzyme
MEAAPVCICVTTIPTRWQSHHQKVVVIDDAVAFSGGSTFLRRWDACDHKADEPRRLVNGNPYPLPL